MSAFCKNNMDPSNILEKLQNYKNDTEFLRKLITIEPLHNPCAIDSTKEVWQQVLTHLIQIISSNSELGNERILLACHAFYSLISARWDSQFLQDTVTCFQKLQTCDLLFLEEQYIVFDLELFKLLNVYGYLQVNRKGMYSNYALLVTFDVLYRNCLTYTRYSYFAYKVLHVWLKRTSNINFWDDDDIILEHKLEAVIFSNWFNDVSKQNAQIFNLYLHIMSNKYKGFLEHTFEMCTTNISWQNETKYAILAEVCQLWNNIGAMTSKGFLFGLCSSLTKNSLRCGGTKLYMVILRKLDIRKWEETFGEAMKFFIDRWESGEYEDHNALQSLFEYWLEPTIEMHRNVLSFLWNLCCVSRSYFLHSHLLRVTAKLHIDRPRKQDIDCCINDKEEIIRLNAFAALCHYNVIDLIDFHSINPFIYIKRFLYYNANATTIFMREGIVKYFQILYSNILKTLQADSTRDKYVKLICDITNWLYKYFLDCFAIGSCYQRKILGLNLYKILLSFTNESLYKHYVQQNEYLRNVAAIDKYLKRNNSWKFTNKMSLFILLRLVLDSALDVRQLATTLILEYFQNDMLSNTEKHVLFTCAWERCNSTKFYEIESGAALMKIIAHWFCFYENKDLVQLCFNQNISYSSYSEFLLNKAHYQFRQMRRDILKAIVQKKPFYGILITLLEIAFHAGPENLISTPQFTICILRFFKKAVDFFISTLSTKTSAYSSSFAEMGLAINERIKFSEIKDCDSNELYLSSAHQVVLSCIWMSLKVLCEIVSEIGMLMESDIKVRCCIEIIATVLLKCRHKGAVESAGVAIANLSRRLYNSKEYCELPKEYLTSLLEDETEKLQLTRRGAGLSIMFHKLVVSDNRKNRPMVHFALKALLHSLKTPSMAMVANIEPGQDSPWAKRLHFLRALVVDKEIHAQLIPYMEDICLLCFKYIESDIWTVRNASLQLYGVVVLRLVGQCSGKKSGMDFGDGCSVNHFITRYPMLAGHVYTQLHAISKIRGTSNAALCSYANIAHSLILLSKMWTGGCDLIDYPSRTYVATIESLLREFLANPMAYVRQLAAKAYAALTPYTKINLRLNMIRRDAFLSCDNNLSHGLLLTAEYLKERLLDDAANRCVESSCNVENDYIVFDSYTHLLRRYRDIVRTWQNAYSSEQVFTWPCYILETLFFQESEIITDRVFFTDKKVFNDAFLMIDHIELSQKTRPGFFQFVELWARLYATHVKVTTNINLKMVHKILDSNCIEQSVGFLNSLTPCISLLEFVLKYLISMKNNRHQLFLDTLVVFTLKTIKHAVLVRDNELKFSKITVKFINKITTNSNVIRVKNALILAFFKDEMLINEVLSHVLRTSADDKQLVRLTTVEYVELALRRFDQLKSANRLTIMQCCLNLLKDENAEIRNVMLILLQSVFKYYAPTYGLKHEEIVYQWLLRDIHLFASISSDDNINIIQYFTRTIKNSAESNPTIENPFYHDNIVFYKEETKFLDLYFLFTNFMTTDASLPMHTMQTREILEEEICFSYKDLRTVLYLKEMDYLVQKRDVVMHYKPTSNRFMKLMSF